MTAADPAPAATAAPDGGAGAATVAGRRLQSCLLLPRMAQTGRVTRLVLFQKRQHVHYSNGWDKRNVLQGSFRFAIG